jgi:antitoxin PrlF
MDHRIGDEENNKFVGLFLDGLSPQGQKAAQEPVLYTEAMAAEDDDLLAGVSVDNEE